jgi:hypothetical protein
MRTIFILLLIIIGLFLGCSSPTEHQSTSYIADVQYEFHDWQQGSGWENLFVTVIIELYSNEEIDVVAECPASSEQPESQIKLTESGCTHNGNYYTFAFHGSCLGWTSGVNYSLEVYLDGLSQYSGSMTAPNP